MLIVKKKVSLLAILQLETECFVKIYSTIFFFLIFLLGNRVFCQKKYSTCNFFCNSLLGNRVFCKNLFYRYSNFLCECLLGNQVLRKILIYFLKIIIYWATYCFAFFLKKNPTHCKLQKPQISTKISSSSTYV